MDLAALEQPQSFQLSGQGRDLGSTLDFLGFTPSNLGFEESLLQLTSVYSDFPDMNSRGLITPRPRPTSCFVTIQLKDAITQLVVPPNALDSKLAEHKADAAVRNLKNLDTALVTNVFSAIEIMNTP